MDDIVVQFPAEKKGLRPLSLIKEIWREITFGVGMWGTLRPLVAALAAAVPLLFLGQHFNRKHRRAMDWTLLQIPLALTVVLWIALWAYSIFDAWKDATKMVATKK